MTVPELASNILKKGYNHIVDERRRAQIERENAENRKVSDWSRTSVESKVFANIGEHIVVSGNNNTLANKAGTAFAYGQIKSDIPVIILHRNNEQLEQRIHSACPEVIINNSRNRVYDPLFGLDGDGISTLIAKSSKTSYGSEIDGDAARYLRLLVDFIRANEEEVTLSYLRNSPHDRIFNIIQNSDLEDDIKNEMIERLSRCEGASGDVKKFLNDVYGEGENLLYDDRNEELEDHTVSIRTAIRERHSICINLSNSTDAQHIWNFIFSEIQFLQNRNERFALLIDSMSLKLSDSLDTLLKNYPGNLPLMYTLDNITTCGEGDLLPEIVNTSVLFCFKHQSGESARKLSNYFGQYLKYEISESRGRGTHQWTSPDHHKHFEVTPKDEFRIRPEEISALDNNQFIVYDGGELIERYNNRNDDVEHAYERYVDKGADKVKRLKK